MSYGRKNNKAEGGQGGKIGHSGMDHRDYTEEIKRRSNKNRRNVTKDLVRKAKNLLVSIGYKIYSI